MKKLILGFTAMFLLAFAACNKDKTTDAAAAIEANEASNDADVLQQESEDEVDAQLESRTVNACPTITFEKPRGTYPNTITVEFTGDCGEGRNGHKRTGKMIIKLSDTLTKTGATKTVTFENFFVDSVKVEGTRKWTNNGKNNAGQPSFTRTLTGGKLTYPDGKTSTLEASHTVTFTAGFDTRPISDNVFSVTGGSSGTTRNGKSFTATITSPLVHKATCPWIAEGVRTVTVDSRTYTLDYGYSEKTKNTCDRQALLTLPDGTTKVINVRK